MKRWPNPSEYLKRPAPPSPATAPEFGAFKPTSEFARNTILDYEKWRRLEGALHEFRDFLETPAGVLTLDVYSRPGNGWMRKGYCWGLYKGRLASNELDGVLLGAGTLYKPLAGKPKAQYIVDVSAWIDESLRGQKLYSKILKRLRQSSTVGPMASDYSLSPGSYYAWVDAGGTLTEDEISPYFKLNPRKPAKPPEEYILYHGTRERIRKFDPARSREPGAIWFSEIYDEVYEGEPVGILPPKYVITVRARPKKVYVAPETMEPETGVFAMLRRSGYDAIDYFGSWLILDPKILKIVKVEHVRPDVEEEDSYDMFIDDEDEDED